MTNKEKYPNAKVKDFDLVFYVSLLHDHYLVNGKVSRHCTKDGYYETYQEAQTALNNFMNETSEITLKEIKLQLEEAKKLVGTKIKNSYSNRVETCERVFLTVERGHDTSMLMNEQIDKKGYCIGVRTSGRDTLPLSMCKEIKTVSVIAHDGQTYTAESDGNCWKFGCAKISKCLIKEAYNLFEKSVTGNRQVEKITIGKCDFTRETLKALVELGE
jgi:hypothetical protein